MRIRDLIVGILCGLGAGLLWGLAFLIPNLLARFSPLAITTGRFLIYGLVSVPFFVASRRGIERRHRRRLWRTALLFALTGNIGYYCLLVFGIRFIGAPIALLLIGTSPVTVALYGNWRRREFAFARLVAPLALILLGTGLVNVSELDWGDTSAHVSGARIALGLAFSLGALSLATWYMAANAFFLKEHPSLSGSAWSSLVGVSTLLPTGGLLAATLLDGPARAAFAQAALHDRGWPRFLVGSAILGLLVSWAAMALWNRASALLPTALLGQMIVFETIAGLFYVFLADRAMPRGQEMVGIALTLLGVMLGIAALRFPKRRHEPAGKEAAEGRSFAG